MEKIIAEILTNLRPEFDFAAETNFVEQGLLDSFDVINLVTELDKQFGISIDGTDILPENFASIETIKNLVQKNGGKS
ncbi:MAG: acyl carrier protein [Bacteroidales bacterium]|nr:acyl carrier protein [Bacteroidales bacterium]